MNDNIKRVASYTPVAFTVVLVTYGAYSLVRLGYEWTKLGIETIKERKELKNH